MSSLELQAVTFAWHELSREGTRKGGRERERERETGRLFYYAGASVSIADGARRRMKNHPVRRGLVDHRGSTEAEWQEWPFESSLVIEHHGRSIVGSPWCERGKGIIDAGLSYSGSPEPKTSI